MRAARACVRRAGASLAMAPKKDVWDPVKHDESAAYDAALRTQGLKVVEVYSTWAGPCSRYARACMRDGACSAAQRRAGRSAPMSAPLACARRAPAPSGS